MKDEILDINKFLNNLSKNISIKESKKGLVLVDCISKMTFSLELDDYDNIIRQNTKHVLSKILKKNQLMVLDCTGGFARDSAIMSSLGNNVTMIEENLIVMRILKDAMSRIRNNKINSIFERITTKLGCCLDYIKTTNKIYDYIYFDFMFNTNSTALPSKREQFLRQIVKNDIDLNKAIVEEVLQRVGCKVIIKEHIKSNNYQHLDIINTYKERVVKYHLLQGKNGYYKLY
tara:strand:+ start:873 stop:1565 length:693 start_codon:yes stop_codon:yes gene_type:complete